MRSRIMFMGFLLLLAQGVGAEDREPFFIGLGELPGGGLSSSANDVSGDGSVVVGDSVARGIFGFEAFRWTKQDGMVRCAHWTQRVRLPPWVSRPTAP